MSPRRNKKARGPAPAALFTWGSRGGVEPDKRRDNPLARRCRACGANPGERCTRPARGGRVPIDSYHDPGRNPPGQDDHEHPKQPASSPTDATTEPDR